MQKPLYFENEGQFLAGTLHLPDGAGPLPGVIFCHGFSGNKIESHFLFVAAARRLAKRGIASLRFDFRGSGESEGEFVDMTVSDEISDARAALNVLARQPEINAARLGIVGLSLGGLVAACAAAREPEVRSTVLWAAVADLAAVVNKTRTAEDDLQISSRGWTDLRGLKLGQPFLDDMTDLRPADELAASDSALLIIHGSADESVPVQQAAVFFAKAQRPGRKIKKLVVEGSDHTFNSVDWSDTVINETAAWLGETL